MSHYGVPLSRGPETQLRPHKNDCSLSELGGHAKELKQLLAVDLFCGAGGLSLGLEEAGFQVILGVDHYRYAVATHRAHFGGVSLCADLSRPGVLKKIRRAVNRIPISLIAGGPPCQPFSRAGKNKIRSLGKVRNVDTRRELWRGFVALVKRLTPRAVLIENVPDMGFGENSIVFRQLVSALEASGYDVYSRILPTWHFGVPQHRQRLILVGVQSGISFKWPKIRNEEKITVRDAISDLPRVSGGAKQVELPYRGASNHYQRWCRKRMAQMGKGKIYDHIGRAVRADDLEAFRLMDHGTLYSDLPARLRRYRADIFDDKYKRLPWDGLSRTITAHIGKDGYWYIHPSQHRTLTVREAARIQTFPDWFRFAGTPSHAFRQIGEAVPPLFGKAIGRAILSAFNSTERSSSRPVTTELAGILTRWLKGRSTNDLMAPWRRSKNLWHMVLGTVLFGTPITAKSHILWKACQRRWPSARAFLKDTKHASSLRSFGLHHKSRLATAIAQRLSRRGGILKRVSRLADVAGLSSDAIIRICALRRLTYRRPVTATIIRVVERFFGDSINGSKMAAELLLARLIGVDEKGLAYAAVLEIADGFCKTSHPDCGLCPLRKLCIYRRKIVAGRRLNGERNRC